MCLDSVGVSACGIWGQVSALDFLDVLTMGTGTCREGNKLRSLCVVCVGGCACFQQVSTMFAQVFCGAFVVSSTMQRASN